MIRSGPRLLGTPTANFDGLKNNSQSSRSEIWDISGPGLKKLRVYAPT
jgi:hypothetical protein